MLSDAASDRTLETACLAAADVVDVATDDQLERDSLWQRLIYGCFVSVLVEADAEVQAGIALRLNDALAKEHIGWPLVRSDV